MRCAGVRRPTPIAAFSSRLSAAASPAKTTSSIPLVRAIDMARVNLLIADDVGLGKTIEAGLVIQELLVRHRARTVLVVCPSSLAVEVAVGDAGEVRPRVPHRRYRIPQALCAASGASTRTRGLRSRGSSPRWTG